MSDKNALTAQLNTNEVANLIADKVTLDAWASTASLLGHDNVANEIRKVIGRE